MKKDFLLNAIGQIDDSLILDAEQAPPTSQPGKQRGKLRSLPARWRYWGGIAAALAVCIGLWAGVVSGVLPVFRMGSGSANAPTAPNATGEAMPGGVPAPSGNPSSGAGFDLEGNYGVDPPSTDLPGSVAGGSGNDGNSEILPGSSKPEEIDKAGALILISGKWYTPGDTMDQAKSKGTALGTLKCPTWGLGPDSPETGDGGEDGTLLTNVPEYEGLTVWEEDGQYFLELSDGSFLTLVPRAD